MNRSYARRWIARVLVPTAAVLGLAAPTASIATAAPAPTVAQSGVGAGLPSDGTPLPPSRDVAGVERQQAAAPTPKSARAAQDVPTPAFTYNTSGLTPHAVPAAELPYAETTAVPLTDTGVHDSSGVRMYLVGTTQYNHPVAQAQYGLANLDSYRLTHNATYLNRAIAQATRLIDTKVESRGAWFYPYPFDFALHGIAADTMKAPWYSGMAQGQALSLFTRLYQVTGDAAWLTAADNTVVSFTLPMAEGLPGVVHVDTSGYLWLDEYPLSTTHYDLTFNGHNFGIFGLYDYAMATDDAVTKQLFDGAVTMSLRYGPNGFRNPGWMSRYCLTHGTLASHYHDVHIDQLRQLYSMTTDSRFAKLSDTFRADFPQNGSATVTFAAGTRYGYKFNSAGAVIATKTIVLSARSHAPSDQYVRIKTRPFFLRISAGTLKGYYVSDAPNITTAIGPFETANYVPQRTATFPAGTTTGWHFNSEGLPSVSQKVTVANPSNAPFSKSATINGERWVFITAGGVGNYWVRASALTLN